MTQRPQAFAQESSEDLSSFNTNAVTIERPTTSSLNQPSLFQGELTWSQIHYLTSDHDDPVLDNSGIASVQIRSSYENNFKADLGFGKETRYQNSYYSVRDLYGQINPGDLHFSIGRKKEVWNEADDVWALGLWQPKSDYDPLNPDVQGIIGVRAEIEEPYIQAGAYYSPIFLPTMISDIQNNDGRLTSESRWYKEPATTSPIMGQRTSLAYSFSSPEYVRLLSAAGGGAHVRVGNNDHDGAYMLVSVADKPMNTILIEYDPTMILSSTAPSAQVQVAPVVGRHTIASVDFGYEHNKNSIVFSHIEDHPRVGTASEGFIRENPGAVRVNSLTVEMQFAMFGADIKTSLSYLKADQDESVDRDSSGQAMANFFPYRLEFYNAIQWRGEWSQRLFRHQTVFAMRALRDFEQEGGILSASITVEAVRNLWVAFGTDFISVDDDSMTNTDRRFLNQFRNNDRVYSTLSYHF